MHMATTALVLAGGRGTRLAPVVADRPKVLAPVAGRPFLAHVLERLAAAGVRHVVLCTGWLASQIRAAFGSCHAGMALEYSEEQEPLGTAGALAHALPLVRSELVLALNGDTLCTADLVALARAHAARAALATVLLARVPDCGRYGRVELDGENRIVRFEEKGARPGPGWVNAGVYCLDRTLLATIPTTRAVSLERESLPAWIGHGLHGHPGEGELLDIGTPDDYAAAGPFVRAHA